MAAALINATGVDPRVSKAMFFCLLARPTDLAKSSFLSGNVQAEQVLKGDLVLAPRVGQDYVWRCSIGSVELMQRERINVNEPHDRTEIRSQKIVLRTQLETRIRWSRL